MANGSFDYKSDPRFKRVRQGAKYGAYDETALQQALQAPELVGTPGYDWGQAFAEVGDVYNPQGTWQDYNKGLLSAMQADPNARDPGFGGMTFSQYQQMFPDQAVAFTRSDPYKAFQQGQMAPAPSPGNPAAVSDPISGAAIGGDTLRHGYSGVHNLMTDSGAAIGGDTGGPGGRFEDILGVKGGVAPTAQEIIKQELISRGFNPDSPRAGNERGIQVATEQIQRAIDAYGGAEGWWFEKHNPTPGSQLFVNTQNTLGDSTIDSGMKDYYNQQIEQARNLARQGRTDFNLTDASIAAQRMNLPSDIDSLRSMVMESYLSLIHISEPTRPY